MSEVITFGEGMIRLAPPHFQRFEQARTFDVEIGGAELNTAVGLSRLGHSVAWASRLPDNPLGRLVGNRVREAGVSDRFLRYAPDGRCGLYFLEFGAAPRASAIVYDRTDSSFARITPDVFDWQSIFQGVKWFHTTGISPAVSETAAEVVRTALSTARRLGITTSFDINYRTKLWPAERAGRVLAELLPSCDLLFASEGDAESLFGIRGETFRHIAEQFCDRFGVSMVVGTRRTTPLVWRNTIGAVGYCAGVETVSADYDVEIVDRLGAGDALAAGVIHGILHGDFAHGVHVGAAMAALQHSIPGDLPWVSPEEVDGLLAGHGLRIRR